RRGKPAVSVDPDPPAAIAERARAAGAPLWQLGGGPAIGGGRSYDYQHAADAWNWHGGDIHYKKLPPPALAGEAQFRNAAGALAAVTLLQGQMRVDEPAIRTGLVRVR